MLMTALLFFHHLDAMLRHGCRDPACQRDHPEGLAWRPRCHPAAGLAVSLEPAAQDLP